MQFFLDAFGKDPPIDETDWIKTFLQKLQCFEHGNGKISFKHMLITYESLSATTHVAKDVTFEHVWQALRRFFELCRESELSEDQACEEMSKIADTIHSHWAKALFRNLGGTQLARREALEASLEATQNTWELPAIQVPVPSENADERFLHHWEAERQRRERGIVGEFAKIRWQWVKMFTSV